MKEKLEALQSEAIAAIEQADGSKAVQDVRVAYLGKKGPITEVLRGMGKLSAEERPIIGELANTVRGGVTGAIEDKRAVLEAAELEEQLKTETIDVTLPGRPVQVGGPHLLTSLSTEIEDLFIGIGCQVREGQADE